jgi:hypothetical protein
MPAKLTSAQWKAAVSGRWRSKEFELVDTRARAFLGDPNPTREQALALKGVLKNWKKTKANWKASVRNQLVPGQGPAIERLCEEVDYFLNKRALDVLRVEAMKILNAFNAELPVFYKRKLDEVFINPTPLVQNFCWHQGPNGDLNFEHNYSMVPGAAAAYPATQVKAFTITLASPVATYPDLNDATQEPANRIMELRPTFTDGTVCHELFHWLTHEQYEIAAKPFTGEANKYIIEGVTEFFTRKVRTDRDATNYQSEFDAVKQALAAGDFTEAQLTAAYLRGVNATAVMNALRDSVLSKLAVARYGEQLDKILANREPVRWAPEIKAYAKKLTRQQMSEDHGLKPEKIQKVLAWQQNPI